MLRLKALSHVKSKILPGRSVGLARRLGKRSMRHWRLLRLRLWKVKKQCSKWKVSVILILRHRLPRAVKRAGAIYEFVRARANLWQYFMDGWSKMDIL